MIKVQVLLLFLAPLMCEERVAVHPRVLLTTSCLKEEIYYSWTHISVEIGSFFNKISRIFSLNILKFSSVPKKGSFTCYVIYS